MHQSISAIDSNNKRSKTRGLSVAASMGAANNFLSLPSVSQDIPTRSFSCEDDKAWLEVAKLCANLVQDDELEIGSTTSARQIISQALSVLASKHCANTKALDSFTLIASLDRDFYGLEYCGDESNVPTWFVGIDSEQNTPYITVNNKIEALEQAYQGLGRTAIFYAEQAGYHTFPIFSPSMGFHQGSYIYWHGLENDDDVLSEIELEQYEEGEILLPSQYKAAFPEIYFSGDILERPALQEIALALAETEVGNTAKSILTIMDLIEQNVRLPNLQNYDAESVYFSAYMSLNEQHTMFNRVLDDFYQSTSEDSDYFTTIYGIAELPFDTTSFCNWRDKMEKGFLLYQKLDELMQLIGEVKQ